MSESLYDFCRKYDRQYLLEEWDGEKNLPLTPDGVTHGSHTMVWWRCGSGHSWQALVYTRTAGSGCPYCAGKKLGQSNDFASLYPDLAVQWDTRKNAPRKPSEFPAGSHHLAWWVCEKGHSWRAQINSRVSGGCGCPVCAGRLVQPGENDLASQFPRLVKEWDIEKRSRLKRAARFGGGALWDTDGRPPSRPGRSPVPVARSVPGSRFCRGSTIWLLNTQNWQRSGIRRETVP